MVNLMPGHSSLLSSGTFLAIAVLARAYHMVNADVDGSGLLFFMMTAPWGWFLPDTVTGSDYWDTLAYPVAWLMIVGNTVIIGLAVYYWHRQRERGRAGQGADSPY